MILKKEPRRKLYQKPTATELTAEEAKLKLIGHASLGDQDARDLLEMMFPEDAKKLSTREMKPS